MNQKTAIYHAVNCLKIHELHLNFMISYDWVKIKHFQLVNMKTHSY